jgi:2'-5' RNA ligase
MVNSEASDQTHKRLFIGIRFIPQITFLMSIPILKLNINKLARVKWTPPENFHFTLWFLGKPPLSFINTLNSYLPKIAYEGFKFELCINQIGTFGGNKPRILWAGIEESEPLTMLYNKINTKLEILGFEKEVGPYHPHLTLGRN